MFHTSLITCVTTETVMVSAPVTKFRPDTVHLYRFSRDFCSSKAMMYRDHYFECVRQIREGLPECRIVEHTDVPVYDIREMIRSLDRLNAEILREDPLAQVLINISSGPNDFAFAAGQFAAMNHNVQIVKVSTKEFGIDEAVFRQIYYENNRPVGLSREVSEPKIVEGIHLIKPNETLIRALRVFRDREREGLPLDSRSVVSELKKRGLWMHEQTKDERKWPLSYSEAVAFEKFFTFPWRDLGWVKKGEGKYYHVTEQGEKVIELFYDYPERDENITYAYRGSGIVRRQ